MICTKRFVKKLRDLKFSFKTRTKSERHDLYMKGEIAIYVPRQDEMIPALVCVELHKAGMPKEEAEAFIKDPTNFPERDRPGK
jgi:hypothetical protein